MKRRRGTPSKTRAHSSRTSLPGVSVILPAYNAEATVERAVESALTQKGCRVELILLDDGSTDGTATKVRKYRDRIRYVRLRNGGASAARNHGIRLSKHPLVAFLDADDEWLPGKLSHQLEVLRERPEVALVSTGARDVDESGRLIRIRSQERSGRLWRALIDERNFIVTSSVLLRKAVLRGLSHPFPTAGWLAEDYWLWLWLAARYDFYVSPAVLVNYTHASTPHFLKKYKESSVRSIFGSVAELAAKEGKPGDRDKVLSFMHSELAVLHARAGRPLSTLYHNLVSLQKDPFGGRTWGLSLRALRALAGTWKRRVLGMPGPLSRKG